MAFTFKLEYPDGTRLQTRRRSVACPELGDRRPHPERARKDLANRRGQAAPDAKRHAGGARSV